MRRRGCIDCNLVTFDYDQFRCTRPLEDDIIRTVV